MSKIKKEDFLRAVGVALLESYFNEFPEYEGELDKFGPEGEEWRYRVDVAENDEWLGDDRFPRFAIEVVDKFHVGFSKDLGDTTVNFMGESVASGEIDTGKGDSVLDEIWKKVRKHHKQNVEG